MARSGSKVEGARAWTPLLRMERAVQKQESWDEGGAKKGRGETVGSRAGSRAGSGGPGSRDALGETLGIWTLKTRI